MNDIKSLGEHLRKTLASKKESLDIGEKLKGEIGVATTTEQIETQGPHSIHSKNQIQNLDHSNNHNIEEFDKVLLEMKNFELDGKIRIGTKITEKEYRILSQFKYLHNIDVNHLVSYLVCSFIQKHDLKTHIKNSLNNLEL